MVFVFDPHSGVLNFQREEVTFDAPFQLYVSKVKIHLKKKNRTALRDLNNQREVFYTGT